MPTTGVTLQDPIYIMKNGSYICMPQITPANATFKRVIWSWEERGNTTDTGITMSNYAWGESTASYTGTVVIGKKEGVYWLRAYCADTNYSDTVDVHVVWNDYMNLNFIQNLKTDISNILGSSPKSILHSYTPNDCLDIIIEYDTVITQYCNQFLIPKAYIQTLLLRELWCYNTSDAIADGAVIGTYVYMEALENWNNLSDAEKSLIPMPTPPAIYKYDSSTGLSQIFAHTAIEANNQAIYRGIINGKVYDIDNWHDVYEMWNLLYNDNEFNIKMLVLEVLDCARKTNTSEIFWEHNEIQTKAILSRYNGTGEEAEKYGSECFDYFKVFKLYN